MIILLFWFSNSISGLKSSKNHKNIIFPGNISIRISIANVSRIYKYGFYSDQLLFFLKNERKNV